MISAAEARKRTTLFGTKHKEIMEIIERNINDNVEIGNYFARVGFSKRLDEVLLCLIVDELKSLGYKVALYPDEPWDPYSYLVVNWEED
jgi:hypothetical protein